MRFSNTFSIFLISCNIFLVLGIFKDDPQLPCALKWVRYSVGSQLPSKTIYSNGAGSSKKQALARLYDESTRKYTIGFYDETLMEAIFPINNGDGKPTVATLFEIGTNQLDCEIDWRSEPQTLPRSDFLVSASGFLNDGTSGFVGRATNDGKMFAGHVTSPTGSISFATNSSLDIMQQSSGFHVLISYNGGLELYLSDITLDTEPFTGIDFAGHDVIENNADVAINQTVTHSKIFRETFRFTLTETWTSTYTSKVRKWFKTRTETTTTTHTNSTTTETFQEREVSVSREVWVPPYTSVEVCSVISIAKDFTTPYSATARYKAKGMTVADVQRILAEDDITDTYTENEDVVLFEPYRGDLTISIAMDTKFIVSPLGDVDGCYGTKKKFLQHKQQEFLKRKSQIHHEII